MDGRLSRFDIHRSLPAFDSKRFSPFSFDFSPKREILRWKEGLNKTEKGGKIKKLDNEIEKNEVEVSGVRGWYFGWCFGWCLGWCFALRGFRGMCQCVLRKIKEVVKDFAEGISIVGGNEAK